MASTASTLLSRMPSGSWINVILEGQGDKKMMPMSDGSRPVLAAARFRAIIAAASIGGRIGSKCGINPGKRTRIRRSTVGQAVLING